MTQKVYDPSTRHPPEYQADTNPDAAAGINYGTVEHTRAGIGWPTT